MRSPPFPTGGSCPGPSVGEPGREAAGRAARSFKEHVSMTSVRRNVFDFETALQSGPELAALAPGHSHSPRVSVSHSPPPPPVGPARSPGEEQPPEEKGAPRRAREPMAAARSGRSWFLSRILSLGAPPLESEAAVSSRGRSRDWSVGQLSKTKWGGVLFFPGVEERKEGAARPPSVAAS